MNGILIIAIAILLSAFFSGMEIAFVASNRLRIELDRKQGALRIGNIELFTNNPGQYIATMLIGNNVSSGYLWTYYFQITWPAYLFLPGFRSFDSAIQTFISTGDYSSCGRVPAKNDLLIISPNFFLKFFSIPTLFLLSYFLSCRQIYTCSIQLLHPGIFQDQNSRKETGEHCLQQG